MRVSPWADRSLAPANSPGPGWESSTSDEPAALSSRRWCSSGSNFAAAWATSRSVMTGPQPIRSASWSSTHRAPALGAGVGSAGRPGGPARRGSGRGGLVSTAWGGGAEGRVRRPSGSAPRPVSSPSRRPATRGRTPPPPGSRHHRATRRRPAPPSRAARGLDPGVGGGGVQDGPLVGQQQAADLDPAGLDLDPCGFGEHAGGVEVSDLDPLPGCRAHGTTQASTTDSRRPQKPLSTRDLRNCWKNCR